MIFAKHQPIVRGERRPVRGQMPQPLEMWGAPVGPVTKHEAAARQELQDVVARLEDLALKRFAAAHNVADALFGFRGDVDGHELAGPMQAGEIRRVALVVRVVLALLAGPFRNERRRNDVARIAPLSQRAVQHIPRAAGLVAGADLALARHAPATSSASRDRSAAARAASVSWRQLAVRRS